MWSFAPQRGGPAERTLTASNMTGNSWRAGGDGVSVSRPLGLSSAHPRAVVRECVGIGISLRWNGMAISSSACPVTTAPYCIYARGVLAMLVTGL
eukprot:253039-Pyramimonas_sp.AAC.1